MTEKSVFNIVPKDFVENQEITLDLEVCIDYVKPSCKIEVVQSPDGPDYNLFVPKVRTKELIVRQVTTDGTEDVAEGPVFEQSLSAFANWKKDTEKLLDECAKLDFSMWKVPKLCKKNPEDE